MKDITSKIYIDGPINTVRLEGEIDGIKKVLYIMMDYHAPIQDQTPCNDIRAENIKNYLIKNFDKVSGSDKTYDFFLEIYPTKITEQPDIHENIYLNELRKMFKKSFSVEKNKIVKSHEFPNVRFHYIDIRDYFADHIYGSIDKLNSFVRQVVGSRYISPADITYIKDGINIVAAQLKQIGDIFLGSVQKGGAIKLPVIPATADELSKYKDEDFDEIVKRLSVKMLEDVQNIGVKKIIHDMLREDFLYYYQKLFDEINKVQKQLDIMINEFPESPYKLNLGSDKMDRCEKELLGIYGLNSYSLDMMFYSLSVGMGRIFDIFIFCFSSIIDMYFLRRFLDKKYITNTTVYTGASHSINYIYRLVKDFNFTITHWSYLQDDIKTVTTAIKRAKYSEQLTKYFFPPNRYQCSDLTNFPDLFV